MEILFCFVYETEIQGLGLIVVEIEKNLCLWFCILRDWSQMSGHPAEPVFAKYLIVSDVADKFYDLARNFFIDVLRSFCLLKIFFELNLKLFCLHYQGTEVKHYQRVLLFRDVSPLHILIILMIIFLFGRSFVLY